MRWWHPVLIAGAIAGILVVILMAPMSLHPASYLYAYAHPGDAMISIWTTWVRLQASPGHLALDHVTLIAAPQGVNLLQYPPEPITEWPLLWLARLIGEVAAFNLLMLLSFPLAAASMALLSFHVTQSRSAAVVSGVLYAFIPYHVAHSMHMSLGAIQWLPLAVWTWLRLHERPGPARACALAAACLAVLWVTVYYAYLLAVASAVFLLWTGLQRPRPITYHRFLGWALVAIGLAGLIASPWLVRFFKAAGAAHIQDVGPVLKSYSRPLKDLFVFAAKPWDYLIPSVRNPIVGSLVTPYVTNHLYGSNIVEQTLYLGIVPLGLTLMAWWGRRALDAKTRPAVGYFLVLAIVALWWSAPPHLPLGTFRIEQNEILSRHRLWFPSGLVYSLIPTMRFLRVYARFGLLVSLAVSVLAGVGWTLVTQRRIVAVGLIALACAEFSVAAPSQEVCTPPPVYTWLAMQPKGLIIEYPFCRSTDSVHAEYLFWQRIHHHPMVNGTPNGNWDDVHRQDFVDLLRPGVPEQLRALGVTYVIIHWDAYARLARAPKHIRVLGINYDVPIRVETFFNIPDEKDLDLRFQTAQHSKIHFGAETVVYQLNHENYTDHRH